MERFSSGGLNKSQFWQISFLLAGPQERRNCGDMGGTK